MTDRNQLKRIGISEARLSAIGMGAPSTTAPAAATFGNDFTRAAAAQQATEAKAARAAKSAALAALTDSAIERHTSALALYRQYRSANAVHRAHLRANYGNEIELGRQLDEFEPPELPPAA